MINRLLEDPTSICTMMHGGISIGQAGVLCNWFYGLPEQLDIENQIELEASKIYAAIIRTHRLRVLVIRGTTEREQWRRYNLAVWPVSIKGDKYQWSDGFYRLSESVYAWARDKDVDLVMGHSLGAASAAIVARSIKAKAICFAKPNILHVGWPWQSKVDLPPNDGSILCICRKDDLICALPPTWLGYRKVGSLLVFDPAMRHRGQDHSMENYLQAIIGRERGVWRWVVPPAMGVGEVTAEKVGG